MRDEWQAAYESWSRHQPSDSPSMLPPSGMTLADWVESERDDVIQEAVDNTIAAFTQVQLFGVTYDEFVTALGDELKKRR